MSATSPETFEARIQTMRDEEISYSPTVVDVYLLETAGYANAFDEHWEPDTANGIPGFSQVESTLPQSTSEDMRTLMSLAEEEDNRGVYAPTDREAERSRVKEARKLNNTFEAAIQFVLNDRVHEPADDAFAAAKQRQEDSDAKATLSRSLRTYAHIAEGLGDRMLKTGDFKLEWIPQAKALAETLRNDGRPLSGFEASPHVARRDRYLTLLHQIVTQLRDVADYVFRDHPKIRQKFTSTYERRRRAEARRLAEEAALEGLASTAEAGQPLV